MIWELLIMFGGSVLGSIIGIRIMRRRLANGRKITSSRYVCECDHSLAYHDPGTNVCHALIQVQHYSGKNKSRTKHIQCTCRRYVGEQPSMGENWDKLIAAWKPPTTSES